MPDGPGPNIRLRHGADLQCRLHPHVHALLLQHIGHGHAVHGSGQHAHMVGAGPLNVALAVLHAAPEVAAADDDTYLHAHVHTLSDDLGHTAHHLKVQSEMLVACQRLAADFNKYPLVFWLVHQIASRFLLPAAGQQGELPLVDRWWYFTLFLRFCIGGKRKNLFFPAAGV